MKSIIRSLVVTVVVAWLGTAGAQPAPQCGIQAGRATIRNSAETGVVC